MGRIPGFSDAIFPAASIPNLNLIANLGLVLFLFLVGLEVDMRYLISNWRAAIRSSLMSQTLFILLLESTCCSSVLQWRLQ
jgi:Kef-type K+ transport system membrane component KefB